jgi:hypothetical protein
MKLDGLPLPQNLSPGEIETELVVLICARGMKLVHDLCVSRSTNTMYPWTNASYRTESYRKTYNVPSARYHGRHVL